MQVKDSLQLSGEFIQWLCDTQRDHLMFKVELLSKADFDGLVSAGELCLGPFCDPPNYKTNRPYAPPEKDYRMAWGVKAADQMLVCAWIQGEPEGGQR